MIRSVERYGRIAVYRYSCNIIYNRRDPYRIDSQILQIVQLFRNARKISPVVQSGIICSVGIGAVCFIVSRVSVIKTVCYHKIYYSFVPVKIIRAFLTFCNSNLNRRFILLIINIRYRDRKRICFRLSIRFHGQSNCHQFWINLQFAADAKSRRIYICLSDLCRIVSVFRRKRQHIILRIIHGSELQRCFH